MRYAGGLAHTSGERFLHIKATLQFEVVQWLNEIAGNFVYSLGAIICSW